MTFPYTGTAYNTYTFAYSYNRDGSLKSQTYPSGRVVDFTYDGSGRPSSVQEPNSGRRIRLATTRLAPGTLAASYRGGFAAAAGKGVGSPRSRAV